MYSIMFQNAKALIDDKPCAVFRSCHVANFRRYVVKIIAQAYRVYIIIFCGEDREIYYCLLREA